MRRPKSHYGTGRNKDILKERFQNIPCTKKPDIDNLIKFVLDALQGDNGFFIDDSQVVSIFAEKEYSKLGSTEIIIENENWNQY